jgi:hypothetical protein
MTQNTTIYTAGPWKVSGHPMYAGFKVIDSKGRSIASFPSSSTRPNDERRTNADLISAAPDMLEALKNADKLITQLMPGIKHIAIQDYGFLNNSLLAITAAIAKATGESA